MSALVTKWEGKIPLDSFYTSGLAGEKTLRAIKNSESFVATVCSDCQVTYFPARTFCERCLGRILENEKPVGPHGTLGSWSKVSINQEGKKTKPYWVGLIKLNGSDTWLLHHLKVKKNQEPTEGSKVKAVFKPQPNRRGSITDILSFEIL